MGRGRKSGVGTAGSKSCPRERWSHASVEKKELRREGELGIVRSDLRIALFGESQQLWLGGREGYGVSWRVQRCEESP
jgi:hypothetical protein